MFFNHYFLYSNNAYLDANAISIAPEVSGKIARVNVRDLQHVTKGQLLFSINDKRYQQQIMFARARLKQAKTQYLKLTNQLSTLKHIHNKNLAQQKLLCEESDRYQLLRKQSLTSIETANKAYTNCQTATQNTQSSEESFTILQTIIGENINAYAPYQEAQAKLNIAKLNEKHTRITAPDNGYVTTLTLQQGDYVNTGQELFSLVTERVWWITAKNQRK